jgi:hypothetical protein
VDTPWLDDVNSFLDISIMESAKNVFDSVFNPTCASNAMSLYCRSAFKECAPVEDTLNGNQLWLPSLLCRSECERYKQIWDDCVAALQTDADLLASFDTQMQALVSLPLIFLFAKWTVPKLVFSLMK